jgi:radical SAM superfamily enzyme
VAYVVSGRGHRTDWLRNVQADDRVQVQVGRRRFDAQAEVVADLAEHRRVLHLWAEQSLRTARPPTVRRILRLFGFDYEGAVSRHLQEDAGRRLSRCGRVPEPVQEVLAC